MATVKSIYRALRTDCHEIRLLRLEPLKEKDHPKSAPKAQLEYITLDDQWPGQKAFSAMKAIVEFILHPVHSCISTTTKQFEYLHGQREDVFQLVVDTTVNFLTDDLSRATPIEGEDTVSGRPFLELYMPFLQMIAQQHFDKMRRNEPGRDVLDIVHKLRQEFMLLQRLPVLILVMLGNSFSSGFDESLDPNLTTMVVYSIIGDLSEQFHGFEGGSISSILLQHFQNIQNCFRNFWKTRFIALSYTWGNPKDTVTMEVNGETRMVTKNLRDALIDIRNHFGPAVLPVWADALSINQEDLGERNKEVKRIHIVYRDAFRVIVWPGRVPEDWNFCGLKPSVQPESVALPTFCTSPMNRDGHILHYLPFSTDSILACLALFELPYWDRSWIFQELLMGQNDTIMLFWNGLIPISAVQEAFQVFERQLYPMMAIGRHFVIGETTDDIRVELVDCDLADVDRMGAICRVNVLIRDGMPFQTFCALQPSAKSFNDMLSDLELRWQCLQKMGKISQRMHGVNAAFVLDELHVRDGSYLTVRILLNRATQATATDERDLVYGVLGLHNERLSSRVVPDYSSTVEKVFTDFSVALIQSMGLDLSFRCLTSVKEDGWPSWIIDFKDKPEFMEFKFLHCPGFELNWDDFVAGGKEPDEPTFNLEKGQMHCKALPLHRLDSSLSTLVESPSLELSKSSSRKSISRHFHSLRNRVRPHKLSQNMNETKIKEQLERVLSLQGKDRSKKRPSIFSLPWEPKESDDYARLQPRSRVLLNDEFWKNHSDFTVNGKELRGFFPTKWELPDLDDELKLEALINLVTRCKLFITADGRLGLVPTRAQDGDTIAIFKGCNMPMVLRRHGKGYKLIGASYIDGLMCGEAIQEGMEWQDLVVV